MKKRFVMALMAMSMTLGACGQNGSAEPATTAETPAAAEAQAEEPSAEPVETAEGSTETETTVIAENAEETEPETVEEKVPYAGSGKAENLTDGIEKVSAPDAKITDAQTQALSQASMQLFAEAVKHEGRHPDTTKRRFHKIINYYYAVDIDKTLKLQHIRFHDLRHTGDHAATSESYRY